MASCLTCSLIGATWVNSYDVRCKADETTTKLLEDDVEKRPSATITERCRFLRSATCKSLSTSTVRRLLKRLGYSQKRSVGAMERDEWLRAAWRVMVAKKVEPERLVFVDARWERTLPFLSCVLGHVRESERTALCPATVGRTPPCSPAWGPATWG